MNQNYVSIYEFTKNNNHLVENFNSIYSKGVQLLFQWSKMYNTNNDAGRAGRFSIKQKQLLLLILVL